MENIERPFECGECKKPVRVCYTEIVGKTISRLWMCEDCPVLREKLHGHAFVSKSLEAKPTAICCGGCGMTLDEVKMGTPLGCALCYDIFSDEVLHQLHQLERISTKIALRKGGPVHAGRRPGSSITIDPALELLTLKQALSETLGREDYEQAAWLRDQIKNVETRAHKEGAQDGRKE